MARKGLGKGLAALFDEQAPVPESEGLTRLPLNQLKPNPNQPRKDFDQEKLAEMAESLRQYGLVQPLIVIKSPESSPQDPQYEIVAGERRWRAAQIANLEELPCIIRELSPEEIMEISLIENIQREDLNILEEANTYHQLMERFEYTQGELARRLGKSRPHIANTLRLLNLEPALQSLLREGHLSPGHGRALLMVEEPLMRMHLAKRMIGDKLSVRQAEELARTYKKEQPAQAAPKAAPAADPILKEIEKRLRRRLATQIKVENRGKGGRIILEYYSDHDLQRLLDTLLPGEEF